ncbi:hypothetical protein STENM223S_04610 [Streptomyces tendae]
MGNGALDGAVIAVAGAGGPAGRAALLRLAEAGATVVGADNDPERLAEAVDAARYAHGGATVTGETVDLLDLDSTRAWADRIEQEFGHVDGMVHLVGGWRGSKSFTKTELGDWDLLEKLLIRTGRTHAGTRPAPSRTRGSPCAGQRLAFHAGPGGRRGGLPGAVRGAASGGAGRPEGGHRPPPPVGDPPGRPVRRAAQCAWAVRSCSGIGAVPPR